MAEPIRVLFLCTQNSARSILAECVLNRMGAGRFEGHSAGSHPAGRVHSGTLELLAREGYPTEQLRSKGWHEFAGPGAMPMNLVITVCDNAAGEACPLWPGAPVRAHWSLPIQRQLRTQRRAPQPSPRSIGRSKIESVR